MSTHAKLTDKERLVMKLLCQGKSPKQIADSMNITRRNVHNHLTKVKDKLGAETSYQACAIFAAIHRARDFIRTLPAVQANSHPWKRV